MKAYETKSRWRPKPGPAHTPRWLRLFRQVGFEPANICDVRGHEWGPWGLYYDNGKRRVESRYCTRCPYGIQHAERVR